MNIFRTAEKEQAEEESAEVQLIPVGRRTYAYFSKRQWSIPGAVPEAGDQIDPVKAKQLAQELTRMFLTHEADQIDLLYTHYISTMSRRITVNTLLPITAAEEETAKTAEYIFEPSPEAIFDSLLPRYVENRVLQAMAESLASEHAARMISMGAATKNAGEVIDHLTLVRNRLRQAAITREISEIVGGADALA
jgi:F-type H+-transporting ATPase subunit gamma